MSGAMVIAVWVQILGGSGGGWRTLARPSRGDSEAGRSGHISRGRRAGRRAGQPLVAVGVGAIFVLELVGRRAAICWSYRSRVMAWSRRRVVAVISGPGRAGQYQLPSARMAPPVLAWMPSWSIR